MTTIIRGRLTADPELRFIPSGAGVANLTIAEDVRKKNPQTQEWETVATTFWRCSIWRDAAENVANSLHKGTAVIAWGQAKQRDWDDRETGQKRSVIEVELDAIGPDLRWQTATVTKAERKGGFGNTGQREDPWATGGGNAVPAGMSEPPFGK